MRSILYRVLAECGRRSRFTSRLRLSDELLHYCSAPGNQLEYQRDYRKHQQNVNESAQCVAGDNAQQPQHKQNYK